jgi:hypothetical protein
MNITPYRDGTTTQAWGNGTVFLEGGSRTLSSQYAYFDITFYTDPTVRGVVLIRGQQLDGLLGVVYVGDYAAGPLVGADTITGQRVEQQAEAALPASRPPSNAIAAPGWGIWKVRQGIDRSYTGCTGFQIDTAAGSEVVVAYDSGAPAR